MQDTAHLVAHAAGRVQEAMQEMGGAGAGPEPEEVQPAPATHLERAPVEVGEKYVIVEERVRDGTSYSCCPVLPSSTKMGRGGRRSRRRI